MELIPLIGLFVVFYVFAIRPQQKRVKAQRDLIAALAVGDEVVTVGGMLGTVVALDDQEVTLRVNDAGTTLRFAKPAISRRIQPESPQSTASPAVTTGADDDAPGAGADGPRPGGDEG